MLRQLRYRFGLRTRWAQLRRIVAAIGAAPAMDYYYKRLVHRRSGEKYYLHPQQALHPVCIRSKSSDIDVFSQIFIQKEYACLNELINVDLVIDCGANAGYSAAYFLSYFGNCHLIALEPDPDNFAMLQCNLAPYGNRAEPIQAGVWSRSTDLIIEDNPYRDGREWTRQVRECKLNSDNSISGVDIGTLLAGSNSKRISILKVDIEGAEAVVFSSNYESWLKLVDAIVIELHDDSDFGNCKEIFFKAISREDFQITNSGELTVCIRKGLADRCT